MQCSGWVGGGGGEVGSEPTHYSGRKGGGGQWIDGSQFQESKEATDKAALLCV